MRTLDTVFLSLPRSKPSPRRWQKIGLRTPISVRGRDGRYLLVTGAHRLAAAKQLGWSRIDCVVIDYDDVQAELWEIAENLHRAEPTVLGRDEQIARWVELVEAQVKGAQNAPHSGGPQPRDKGIKRALQELGIERTKVPRAVKVGKLSPEANQAAKEAGLDDNRLPLLVAASYPRPSLAWEWARATSIVR